MDNHNNIAENDQIKIFNDYFKIFPWEEIDKKTVLNRYWLWFRKMPKFGR